MIPVYNTVDIIMMHENKSFLLSEFILANFN